MNKTQLLNICLHQINHVYNTNISIEDLDLPRVIGKQLHERISKSPMRSIPKYITAEWMSDLTRCTGDVPLICQMIYYMMRTSNKYVQIFSPGHIYIESCSMFFERVSCIERYFGTLPQRCIFDAAVIAGSCTDTVYLGLNLDKLQELCGSDPDAALAEARRLCARYNSVVPAVCYVNNAVYKGNVYWEETSDAECEFSPIVREVISWREMSAGSVIGRLRYICDCTPATYDNLFDAFCKTVESLRKVGQ